jgi:hypothetical protein
MPNVGDAALGVPPFEAVNVFDREYSSTSSHENQAKTHAGKIENYDA